MQTSGLANEWSLLQNQYDSYEKYSLIIKLVNVGVLCAAYFSHNISVFVIFLLLILWMQDAIWKTFQSRIDTRLLQLEHFLSSDAEIESANNNAYQFNTQYLKSRHTGLGLINEYFRQALRPTIAFPHVILLMLLGFKLLF